jgi:hypothetical protein
MANEEESRKCIEAYINSVKTQLINEIQVLLKKHSVNTFGHNFLTNLLINLHHEKTTHLNIKDGVCIQKIYTYILDVIKKYFDGINKTFGFFSKEISIHIFIVEFILGMNSNSETQIIDKINSCKKENFTKKHSKLSINGFFEGEMFRPYSWSSLDILLCLDSEEINKCLAQLKHNGPSESWFNEPAIRLGNIDSLYSKYRYNYISKQYNRETYHFFGIKYSKKPRHPFYSIKHECIWEGSNLKIEE